MSDNERIATLQIIRGSGIGPVTYARLLKKYKTAQNVVDCWQPSQDGARPGQQLASRASVLDEMEAHDQFGAELIYRTDPTYPSLLHHITDAPPVFSAKGRLDLLKRSYVGIVGARNGSIHGCKIARALAEELGRQSWGVISGLARGIDAAAHMGSLTSGTIGVLASGINIVYPQENRALYEAMAEEGVIITEMGFGVDPHATLFPRRNGIIAGIASGVVVVEAALQSGSLLTAKYALEYNRDVFAVPGSPMDPRCRGTNKLLKEGAVLVESAHDILDVLVRDYARDAPAPLVPTTQPVTFSTESRSLEEKIIDKLSVVPVAIDDLSVQLNILASHMMSLVLELEVKGRVTRLPGNQLVRLDQ